MSLPSRRTASVAAGMMDVQRAPVAEGLVEGVSVHIFELAAGRYAAGQAADAHSVLFQ